MVSYFYDWFGKNNEELQRNLRMFKDAGKNRLVKRNGEDKGFKGKMRKIHTLLCETLDLVRGPLKRKKISIFFFLQGLV